MLGSVWIQQRKKFILQRLIWELKNTAACFLIAGNVSDPSLQARQSLPISLPFVLPLLHLFRIVGWWDQIRRDDHSHLFFASGFNFHAKTDILVLISRDYGHFKKKTFLSVEWLWCCMYIFGLKKFRKKTGLGKLLCFPVRADCSLARRSGISRLLALLSFERSGNLSSRA